MADMPEFPYIYHGRERAFVGMRCKVIARNDKELLLEFRFEGRRLTDVPSSIERALKEKHDG